MNRWYSLLESVLADVRARGPPAESDVSLMAHLLRIVDPATGLPLTDAQLLPELGIVFVAGMETSGKTMGWTLCALLPSPLGSLLAPGINVPLLAFLLSLTLRAALVGTASPSTLRWRLALQLSWMILAYWQNQARPPLVP